MTKIEMRKARRYNLALPVALNSPFEKSLEARSGRTRDISSRGVYFLIESELKPGHEVNLTMTIPAEGPHWPDVLIHVTGKVVRVENSPEKVGGKIGAAATIDRYEMTRRDPQSHDPS